VTQYTLRNNIKDDSSNLARGDMQVIQGIPSWYISGTFCNKAYIHAMADDFGWLAKAKCTGQSKACANCWAWQLDVSGGVGNVSRTIQLDQNVTPVAASLTVRTETDGGMAITETAQQFVKFSAAAPADSVFDIPASCS
jgi:hypothetical protein